MSATVVAAEPSDREEGDETHPFQNGSQLHQERWEMTELGKPAFSLMFELLLDSPPDEVFFFFFDIPQPACAGWLASGASPSATSSWPDQLLFDEENGEKDGDNGEDDDDAPERYSGYVMLDDHPNSENGGSGSSHHDESGGSEAEEEERVAGEAEDVRPEEELVEDLVVQAQMARFGIIPARLVPDDVEKRR